MKDTLIPIHRVLKNLYPNIKMSLLIDFRTLPISIPSLCIPRVFSNIDEKRIRRIFDELNLGIIEQVDIVNKTTEKGEKFNRVFVHFKRWFSNANADTARERLLNGKEIKIIYDDPWFWKVSAYRPPQEQQREQVPRPQKKRPTLQFDDSDNEEDEFGRDRQRQERPQRQEARERPQEPRERHQEPRERHQEPKQRPKHQETKQRHQEPREPKQRHQEQEPRERHQEQEPKQRHQETKQRHQEPRERHQEQEPKQRHQEQKQKEAEISPSSPRELEGVVVNYQQKAPPVKRLTKKPSQVKPTAEEAKKPPLILEEGEIEEK
jgi:hypothetical protein